MKKCPSPSISESELAFTRSRDLPLPRSGLMNPTQETIPTKLDDLLAN